MNVSDVITLAAVLVALGLGASSLIQTYGLQKRERRERLLNEIIEWATLISSQTSGTIFEGLPEVIRDSQKHGMYIYSYLSRVRTNLWGAVGRNIYMLSIAHLFGIKFGAAIGNLIENMTDYMEFLDTWQEKNTIMLMSEIKFEKDDIDEIDNLSNCVNVAAIVIIEQGTKIKTRDIS